VNRALVLLVLLQLRGWLRYVSRNLRTAKGVLLAGVGALFLGMYLTPILFLPERDPNTMTTETVLTGGPILLLVYCILSVLFSSQEKAIYFAPAEVNFLFSGPFSRRQILAYKVVQALLVGMPSGIIMAVVVPIRGTWFFAKFLGMMQVLVFFHLFGIVLGLLASAAGAHLYSRGRRLALAVVALFLGVIVLQSGVLHRLSFPDQGPREVIHALAGSASWQAVSTPLRWFFEMMLAHDAVHLLLYFCLAGVVNLALVGAIFGLDAHFLEASAAYSARFYARIQQARGRSVALEETRSTKPPRLSLPMPPYLGGVGPIVWRQLTSAMRGMGRLLLILLILGLSLAVPLFAIVANEPGEQPRRLPGEGELVGVLLGSSVWLTFFLTTLVPFDFRGDIDRLATLKTLPLPPWRIALAQLIVPTLVLSAMQLLGIGLMLVVFPQQGELLAGAALFAPVGTFLLLGIENLLFLVFPVRVMATTPGDIQAMGRNILLVFARLFAVGVVGSAAALVGVAAGLLIGYVWVGVATAWLTVACGGLALLPFISQAFQAFDVARDTPA
jgi:Putative ABC exporter